MENVNKIYCNLIVDAIVLSSNAIKMGKQDLMDRRCGSVERENVAT